MKLIPAFLQSGRTRIKGDGKIFIPSRRDSVSSGMFGVSLAIRFGSQRHDDPHGNIRLKTDLSDSLKGTFTATSIELVHANKKQQPVVFLTGSCKAFAENAPDGLRYWLKLACDEHKKEMTEYIGFVVHDQKGNRVAYGTGPLVSGTIKISPKNILIKAEPARFNNRSR